jgi:hypothetical protein
MRRTLSCLATVVVGLASPAAAQAQEYPAPAGLGFGLNVGYVELSGQDFDLVGSGVGVEATGRYTWESGFQVLLGVQYSSHTVIDQGDLTVIAVSADPRYVLRLFNSDRLAPFLGGRVSYVYQSLSDGGESANGFVIGGEVGFIFEFLPPVAIEASGYFGGLLLDGRVVEGVGSSSGNASGTMGSARIGVLISLH